MRGRAAKGLIAAALLLGAAACSHATAPEPTTTSTSTTAATRTAAFESAVEPVTEAQLSASWRPGCPFPVEDLRLIRASHWGYDGEVHEGSLVVDEAVADDLVSVLSALFDARYPIERMEPIDRYGGDDLASTQANNTSAFNCRRATGGTGWSQHAYGRAIDLNPLQNPYVRGDVVLPPEAAGYVDRSRVQEGMITESDAAVQAFAAIGWPWGGHWSSLKDYQHFSLTGR
jgi:hypothetical protein